MLLIDNKDQKCIGGHPIFFGLENGNLYIYIQDRPIGFVSEFSLVCKQGITALKIQRINYIEGTWDKEWEKLFQEHANIFQVEHVDLTHLGPHFEVGSHRSFFKEDLNAG